MKKKTKNMHDSTKKNKLPLFRSPRQKEPPKDKQQISSLKSDCALFSRLFFSGQLEKKTWTIFLNMKTKVEHHHKVDSFVFQERNPT